MHTPILTANDCEGAGEVFVVEVNFSEAFLLHDTTLAWYMPGPCVMSVSLSEFYQ